MTFNYKIHIPRPTFDNPNDRYRLFLLQHINCPGYRHKRELRKLSAIYPNNHLFEEQIIDELSASEFIQPIDLEPEKPHRSETGETIPHKLQWSTTPTGENALLHSRFPSETKQLAQKSRALCLDWFIAVSTTITAVIAILSLFL